MIRNRPSSSTVSPESILRETGSAAPRVNVSNVTSAAHFSAAAGGHATPGHTVPSPKDLKRQSFELKKK